MRYPILIAVLAFSIGPAEAVGICSGSNRAARKVTCVVDGDTIWQTGVKMRLLDIDAPELHGACPAEIAKARKATGRLASLMARGYRIKDSGDKDRTSDRRSLVRIILSDGRDAGAVLISEGLAQPWPNDGNKWCRVDR